MRRPLVALLVALSALAGCVGSATPPAEDDVTPAGTVEPRADDAAEDEETPAPAPATNSTSSQAGGGGASGQANATSTSKNQTPVPPPPPPPRARQVNGEGSVTLKARAACPPEPAPCPPVEHEAAPVELALPEPNPAKAVLVAAWEAGQTTASLAFNVTTPEGVVVASAEGESPLTLTLPADALKGAAKLLVAAAPPAPGAMAQQTYQLTLSLEYA